MKEIEAEKQDFSIGCRVLLWLPDVKGNVGGIILNHKEGRRNRLFLITTPIDILWVGGVSPFPPDGNDFKECLRPDPLLCRREDLLPEHTRDSLGSWEFIYQHPDIGE
jgi:hypothetical protein